MQKKFINSSVKAVVIFSSLFMTAQVVCAEEKYLSPQYICKSDNNKTLYVAETTGNRVAFLDAESAKVKKEIKLTCRPNGVAVSSDEKKLFVTGGDFDGKVFFIDIRTAKVTDSLDTGHSPTAPVASRDGKTLYVCNRFDNHVVVIDLAGKKIRAKIPVVREPISVLLTSDGKKLYVANSLPAGRASEDYVGAKISLVDTENLKLSGEIVLPNGSTGIKAMTFSPDGRYIYVTHILARYQLPTTQIERGWMNTNAMTIIDVSSDKVLTTVLLDDADLGAANPWGAACSEDGKYVCVSHSGSGEISVIDRIQLHEKLDRVSKGQRVSDATSCLADVPNDLSFLSGLRRRIRLEGIGPRNMVLIGSKGYVCEYFSDSIGVFELEPSVTAKAVSLPLGPSLPLTSVRQGEIFFHDASLCFQKWQSCASCHPGDARADSLNWDLLNDGIGNPKNTKSMLYAHPTPPSMMGGVRENAEAAVRAGIRYIQFAIRPDADAAAIDEYLKSLRPLPSPLLVKDSKSGKPVLSESAIRGKQIYEKARCADCHCGPYFTNQKKYDVGTGTGVHQGSAFDTPTLIEVWRTAPYLYDGRAATMKEVLRQFNPDDKHGITSDLTDKEIDQLAEYVLSL